MLKPPWDCGKSPNDLANLVFKLAFLTILELALAKPEATLFPAKLECSVTVDVTFTN